MSDDLSNSGLSTQQLVEQAKQLAKAGHFQEAIDMTDGISHPKVQEWRNGLKAKLAQQRIADRKKDGQKRQVYIGVAVALIALIVIFIAIFATRSPQPQQNSDIIVLVTNTLTPDATQTSHRATSDAGSTAIVATNIHYMKQWNATRIAEGTPCFSDCPDGYSTPTALPN